MCDIVTYLQPSGRVYQLGCWRPKNHHQARAGSDFHMYFRLKCTFSAARCATHPIYQLYQTVFVTYDSFLLSMAAGVWSDELLSYGANYRDAI